MAGPEEAILLLGGNMGEVRDTFARAIGLIEARIGPVRSSSRDHWTEPWGFADTRLFLNRALLVPTALPADAVLDQCLAIERELGRVRRPGGGYGPRTIDIDILFFGASVIHRPGLTLPHPRVHERLFALGPAADIAPDLLHPVLGRTVLDLLNDRLQASRA